MTEKKSARALATLLSMMVVVDAPGACKGKRNQRNLIPPRRVRQYRKFPMRARR